MGTRLPLGRVAASAAIIRRKKILLLQRTATAKNFPLYWTFPSGGVEEFDESLSTAVIREVKEETGLDFIPTKKFSFYEIQHNGHRSFSLVHLGRAIGDITPQISEVADWAWFTYKGATKLPLAFNYHEVIKDLHRSGLL